MLLAHWQLLLLAARLCGCYVPLPLTLVYCVLQALIDGPSNITGVKRQLVNFKNIALTDLKADGFVEVDGKRTRVCAARNARQKSLSAVWTKLGLKAKWEASSWGKRVAGKVAESNLTDLGRFKAKLAHQKTARAIRAKLSQ